MFVIVLVLSMFIALRVGRLVEEAAFGGLTDPMGPIEQWILSAHVIPIVFMVLVALCGVVWVNKWIARYR